MRSLVGAAVDARRLWQSFGAASGNGRDVLRYESGNSSFHRHWQVDGSTDCAQAKDWYPTYRAVKPQQVPKHM